MCCAQRIDELSGSISSFTDLASFVHAVRMHARMGLASACEHQVKVPAEPEGRAARW
jgi:hypothetical protein